MADLATDWNNHLRDIQIPNTVYLSLVFLVGMGGNALVLYVYTFKMRKDIEERYFIPVLALMDLITCLISISFYITEIQYAVTYPSGELCKFFYFTSIFSTGASAHILFVIALQRYLKICRPTGKQMTLKWKRISTGIVVLLALIYAAPLPYYSDTMEVSWTYQGENVTGITCEIAAAHTGESAFYYLILLTVVIIVNIIATVVMYVPIGCVIYKRFKSIKDRKLRGGTNTIPGNIQIESSKSESGQSTTTSVDQPAQSNTEFELSVKIHTTRSDNEDKLSEKTLTAQPNSEGKMSEKTQTAQPHSEGKMSEKSQTAQLNTENKLPEKSLAAQPNSEDKMSEKTLTAKSNNENKLSEQIQTAQSNTEGKRSEKTVKKQKQARKIDVKTNFNRMFLAIILFYVISYITTLIIIFLNQSFDNFWFNLNDNLFVICAIVGRMFILNHVVNPIIYGFYDMRFRAEVRSMFWSFTMSRRRGADLSK